MSAVKQVKVAGCANIARPRARSWHTFISAAVTPSSKDTVSNEATLPYSRAAEVASLSYSSGLLLLVCVNSYKPELLPMFRFLLSMWANVDTLITELAKQHVNKMAQTEMLQWILPVSGLYSRLVITGPKFQLSVDTRWRESELPCCSSQSLKQIPR